MKFIVKSTIVMQTGIELVRKNYSIAFFQSWHSPISIWIFRFIFINACSGNKGYIQPPNVRPPILPFDQIHEILADELIALVQQLTTEIQNH